MHREFLHASGDRREPRCEPHGPLLAGRQWQVRGHARQRRSGLRAHGRGNAGEIEVGIREVLRLHALAVSRGEHRGGSRWKRVQAPGALREGHAGLTTCPQAYRGQHGFEVLHIHDGAALLHDLGLLGRLRADDGDGSYLGAERQDARVLEQHGPLRDEVRDLGAPRGRRDVRRHALRGMLENTHAELRDERAQDDVVEAGLGHDTHAHAISQAHLPPEGACIGDRRATVEPGHECRHDRALRGRKVGPHRAIEAELVLQDAEQLRVLAGINTIDPRKRTHHATRTTDPHGRLETRQVDLAQRAFGHHVVLGGLLAGGLITDAPLLLGVHRVVLHLGDDVAIRQVRGTRLRQSAIQGTDPRRNSRSRDRSARCARYPSPVQAGSCSPRRRNPGPSGRHSAARPSHRTWLPRTAAY